MQELLQMVGWMMICFACLGAAAIKLTGADKPKDPS